MGMCAKETLNNGTYVTERLSIGFQKNGFNLFATAFAAILPSFSYFQAESPIRNLRAR